jgi:hypothetical protein
MDGYDIAYSMLFLQLIFGFLISTQGEQWSNDERYSTIHG